VAVQKSPTGLTCRAANATGIMGTANVGNVVVTCSDRPYTLGGSSGSNARGVYGTQGSAAPGNVPGARLGAVAWNGSTGRRWMFGGVGYDANGNSSDLSDLWSYSETTHQWTWVGGPDTIAADGTYGTQGVAASGNLPSSRKNSMTWTDGSGNLWLYGGYHDNTNNGYLNDLWSYNPGTNQWTWVGGSNLVGAAGVCGTQGIAAAGNAPGARQSPTSWQDAAGRFWLFGGYGLDHTTSDGYSPP